MLTLWFDGEVCDGHSREFLLLYSDVITIVDEDGLTRKLLPESEMVVASPSYEDEAGRSRVRLSDPALSFDLCATLGQIPKPSRTARNRWFLALTLSRNPQLHVCTHRHRMTKALWLSSRKNVYLRAGFLFVDHA